MFIHSWTYTIAKFLAYWRDKINMKQTPLNKPLRKKSCKWCKCKFLPQKPLQINCSPRCAIAWANAEIVKKKNRDLKARKLALKPKREWLKQAQREFNRFIRLRDYDKPCVSCGRVHVEMTSGGNWDAGHYLTVGAYPEHRFNEDNCHKQCKKCNGGGGRFARKDRTVTEKFKAEIIKRIGLERVQSLSVKTPAKKYSIDDLRALQTKYRIKANEMQKEIASRND